MKHTPLRANSNEFESMVLVCVHRPVNFKSSFMQINLQKEWKTKGLIIFTKRGVTLIGLQKRNAIKMNHFDFFHLLAMPPICRMTDDAAVESRVMAMIDIGCASLRT